MKLFLPLFCLGVLAHAQAPAGVSAAWDISQTIDSLSLQAARLKPLLEQVTPREWTSRGAPGAYVEQHQNAQNDLGYLLDAAKAFQKQPERLTLAFNTYFRMQAVEQQIDSLVDGVRQYQNPAVGDALVRTLADNSPNRDKLRDYIADLAATKEQEFKIADNEAQRCRTELIRQPPARPAAKKAEPAKTNAKPAEPK